ncbi:lactococcin 972 family bacteriocin [Curtobacterium sp. VKM Ac-2852]|nr:lactococcin 972 family bacteriocin [Curtobacterium sp. VKM Ac-2852]
MIKMKFMAVATALVAGAMLAVPATAQAAQHSEKVGGGLWNWGQDSGKDYSHYYHKTKFHTATVCNGKAGGVMVTCNKKAVEDGKWAKVSMTSSASTGHAYWNVL